MSSRHPCHAGQGVAEVVHWQHGGGVSPILERLPFGNELLQMRVTVSGYPARENVVVGAGDDRNRVQLNVPEVVERTGGASASPAEGCPARHAAGVKGDPAEGRRRCFRNFANCRSCHIHLPRALCAAPPDAGESKSAAWAPGTGGDARNGTDRSLWCHRGASEGARHHAPQLLGKTTPEYRIGHTRCPQAHHALPL